MSDSRIKLEAYIDESLNFNWNMTDVQEQLLTDLPTMLPTQIIRRFPDLSVDMLISFLCRTLVEQNKELYKLRSNEADRIILELDKPNT